MAGLIVENLELLGAHLAVKCVAFGSNSQKLLSNAEDV